MEKQVPFIFSNHTILLDVPNRISIAEHASRLLEQWNLPIFVLPSKFLRFLKGQQEIQPVLDQWFKLVEVNPPPSHRLLRLSCIFQGMENLHASPRSPE